MFGLSFFELLAIFTIALLVFGPEKLPEIAKLLGKFSGELKKTSDSVRREFYNSIYPPAEELQATYRKLTTTPLAQLEGTCEEKTKLPDATQENKGQQLEESGVKHSDSEKSRSAQPNSDPISTLNVVHNQRENTNSNVQKAPGPSQIKSESPKGE